MKGIYIYRIATSASLRKRTCRPALMKAFPMSVAKKKTKNGTMKYPQVIPAKSNNGFGI
jgi:hypothetical protein